MKKSIHELLLFESYTAAKRGADCLLCYELKVNLRSKVFFCYTFLTMINVFVRACVEIFRREVWQTCAYFTHGGGNAGVRYPGHVSSFSRAPSAHEY